MTARPQVALPRSADVRLVSRHRDVYEPCDDSFALVDALMADQAHLRELDPKLCVEVKMQLSSFLFSFFL